MADGLVSLGIEGTAEGNQFPGPVLHRIVAKVVAMRASDDVQPVDPGEPVAPGSLDSAGRLGSAGRTMESESDDDVIDGLHMCSREMPGGMDFLVEPSLESMSAVSLRLREMWWNSHPSK